MTDFALSLWIQSTENDIKGVKKSLLLAIKDGTDKQNIDWLTARLKYAEHGLRLLKQGLME